MFNKHCLSSSSLFRKSLSSVYLSSSKFSETLQLWTDVTGGEESNLRGNLIFTQNFQKMSKHIFGTRFGNFWTKLSENVQNTSLEQDLTFTEYPKDWKTLHWFHYCSFKQQAVAKNSQNAFQMFYGNLFCCISAMNLMVP